MCSTCELNASISFDLCANYVFRNILAQQAISRYSQAKKSCWSSVKWPTQPNGKNRTTDRFRCTAFVAMRKFLSRVHLLVDDMYGRKRDGEYIRLPENPKRFSLATLVVSSSRYRNSILFARATCTTRVIRFAGRSSAHSRLIYISGAIWIKSRRLVLLSRSARSQSATGNW